ncbi:MAG: InlB B-repeat-containing protein [Oscillospiraceae bacterium]|nr:InlB B-repeat-containing protein [Oscillospiraceae bacterium]
MKISRMQRTLAVMLSLFMLMAVCPLPAFAEDVTVTYLKRRWDSVNKVIVETDDTVTNPLTTFPSFQTGEHWYYVSENKTFENRVTIPDSSYVNLIIGDNVTINCKKGIHVPSSAMLNIYCQPGKTGKLIAAGDDYNAGIGSNDEAEVNGAIRIYGGVIEATGGDDAAGIGGANEVRCGLVEIYGGTVTAQGGPHAAGIGDGDEAPDEAGTVNIYGGTITATGGDEGAGIGGGCESRGPVINIYGGKKITATGGQYGAGVGGGYKRGAREINISGCEILDAYGGEQAAGIGEGCYASSATSDGIVRISGGDHVNAFGGEIAAGIGGGFHNSTEMKIYISGGNVSACGGQDNSGFGGAGIGAGGYLARENIAASGGDFEGEVVISGGEVYACGAGNSKWFGGAGIGAGNGGNMQGTVKITGGSVHACGMNGGAAIGAGGEQSFGEGGECEGTVEITGGTVQLDLYYAGYEGNYAVLIGHGADGTENGTLVLGDTMCVMEGDMPVAAGERASLCHTGYYCASIKIAKCYHPVCTHTYVDELRHRDNCQYCLYSELYWHEYTDGSCICGSTGYYNVFYYSRGQIINSELVPEGGTATRPADPTSDGYAFGDWYIKGTTDYRTPFDFSAPITEDIDLEAHWMAWVQLAAYNKTVGDYMSGGGKVRFAGDEEYKSIKQKKVELNSFAEAQCIADEGYEFVGWATYEDPETIISTSRTLGFNVPYTVFFVAVFQQHVHSPRHYSYEAPECEWNGNIEYWYCSGCGKYFTDEDCEHEISRDETVIPYTGHTWNAEWAWDADFTEAYVTLECENCHDKYSYIEADVSIDEETGVYKATVEFDGETFTDTKTVMTLTFDMGGKCENLVLLAEPGESMILYYFSVSSAAKADGYWFEGVTPQQPESYETEEAFTAANKAVFYGEVPDTDTVYYVSWRTLETPSIGIGSLKCGASLDETLPEIAIAEPDHARITGHRWVDGVSGTAVGGQDYQMYVCLNATLHRGFTKEIPVVSGAAIDEYDTSAIQDSLFLSVTAQHYVDETSRRTENVVTPATATQAGVKEICVYCAGGCGEVVERYTETIPATDEPDTPDDPAEPADPDTPSGSGLCKWCEKDHSGSFWQRIVGFFHSVLYFFAHLFGRR